MGPLLKSFNMGHFLNFQWDPCWKVLIKDLSGKCYKFCCWAILFIGEQSESLRKKITGRGLRWASQNFPYIPKTLSDLNVTIFVFVFVFSFFWFVFVFVFWLVNNDDARHGQTWAYCCLPIKFIKPLVLP